MCSCQHRITAGAAKSQALAICASTLVIPHLIVGQDVKVAKLCRHRPQDFHLQIRHTIIPHHVLQETNSALGQYNMYKHPKHEQ